MRAKPGDRPTLCRTVGRTTLPLEDVIEWDVPNWSVALDFWAAHSRIELADARGLEIGGRHGGLSLWAAHQGMEMLCTDVHDPTPLASERHRRYGVADRIRLASVDATDIPFADEFDVAMFKSVLGGIGAGDERQRQVTAMQQLHKALRRGGELWFAENLVASPAHQFFRRRFVSWARSWRYVTLPEMRELTSTFSEVHLRTLGFAGAFGRTDRQRSLLGRLDRVGLDRVVPDSWHYIVVGVARK